ncbi:MAG TPA: hypothetical protein VMT19_06970 [Thermoanaerobaculaceae bacterium]|nr:hypothetical protein [Thermoanaerobaculaceae bacterium]
MAERVRVGLLIPNLFMRVPVEAAVRGRADAVALADAAAATGSGCRAVIADLDALGADPVAAVGAIAAAGASVLVFGPHVEGERLAAVRAAGAVVLPRSVFLERLPELLDALLGARGAE